MRVSDAKRDAAIIADSEAGLSLRQLAAKHNLSCSRVSQILIKHRGRIFEFERVTEDEADEIVRLAEQAVHLAEIARRMDRSEQTVRRALKLRGVSAVHGLDSVGPDVRDKAVGLVGQGLSYGQVALRLGIRRGVIAGAVSRARRRELRA